MAWKKVVTESSSGVISQEAATLTSQGALATLDAVDSGQITNGSIDTAHIANDQITAALMADNSIDSDMYVNASIDTAHIGNDQITDALMADNAVAGDTIGDEQIAQGKLADNSVITSNITDANITLAKMASASVDEDNLQISNSPTNGQFLSAQSGNTGGMTWATPTDISTVANLTDTTITSSAASEILFTTGANAWANKTLAEAGIQATITGAATTIDTEDLTASVAMVTDSSGKVAVSAVTATELGYVDGVSSSIQTQLDAKEGTVALTASRALVSSSGGVLAVSAVTDTELGYVDGVTSSIQTQLGTKQADLSADAAMSIGSSGFLLDTAGNFTVDENFTATGTSTLTGAVTIAGNLTVNGTTTTISTANLEVEDKEIVLGTPDSAYANDAAAATGASGGGIALYTDSSGTTNNFAKMSWGVSGELTGWTAEDTQDAKFPIAMMEFSTDSTAPTGNAAGVGSFHFDTGDDSLYIRTS